MRDNTSNIPVYHITNTHKLCIMLHTVLYGSSIGGAVPWITLCGLDLQCAAWDWIWIPKCVALSGRQALLLLLAGYWERFDLDEKNIEI